MNVATACAAAGDGHYGVFGTWYTDFVEGAWFGPARRLTRSVVVPNGVLFTLTLIVFQVIVAVSILARGAAVAPALVAGGVFAAVVALFSSSGGAVGNLGLAALQRVLAAIR
ncbi:MAG: hypothetical protein OER95_18340 [Acidimicrobiia bacterium]|nr:hypothetical protein [Acidimicrobiia bacterium]